MENNTVNTQGQEPINNNEGNVGVNGVANQKPQEPQQPPVKTFTQEEVDKLIAKRLDRERKKYEEEIGKTKFQEGLTEAEKLAKMTAQEKAEYEFNKKVEEFNKKQKEFEVAQLKVQGNAMLQELGYNADQIEALGNFINFENADTTKSSIEALDKIIKETVDQMVNAKIDQAIVTKTKPQVGVGSNLSFTWDDVLNNKCSYADYIKHNNK